MKRRKSTTRHRSDNRLGHGTYDQFFTSGSRPTPIQFWGLVVLGGTLIAGGVSLLFTVLTKLAGASSGPFAGMVFLIVAGISASFVYFGAMHLKRAFVGKR
jgi:hypothetical protein